VLKVTLWHSNTRLAIIKKPVKIKKIGYMLDAKCKKKKERGKAPSFYNSCNGPIHNKTDNLPVTRSAE
jgi:hypothetical protein